MNIQNIEGCDNWNLGDDPAALVKFKDEKWRQFKPCFLQQHIIRALLRKKKLEVYDDDVFICTFPRSGTTVTQELTWLILNEFDYDGAKNKLLEERSPMLEMDEAIQFILSGGNIQAINDSFSMLKRPRLIKTHLPIHLLPDEIWTKKPNIIHVSREVKDVAVSCYHMFKGAYKFSSIDEYFKAFIEGTHMFGPYREHVLDYKNIPDYERILYLTYEEIMTNINDVIIKVGKFLNIEVSTDNRDKLKQHLKFDSMKKNGACNGRIFLERTNEVRHTNLSTDEFIRKGVVGGHIHEMSKEWIERFDDWIAEKIDSSWENA